MSGQSIRQIGEAFFAKIPEACAAGNGEALLHDFARAIAHDFAMTVFLKMDAVVQAATPDQGAALLEWVNDFPHQQGLSLIAGITSTIEEFHGSPEQIKAAEVATATAYQQRLEELMENAQPGGSA